MCKGESFTGWVVCMIFLALAFVGFVVTLSWVTRAYEVIVERFSQGEVR